MIDSRTAPYAALLLRVALGAWALIHAGLKIFVFTPAGTVGFFQSLGLPGPLAYLVIAIEVVTGIAMILGVYTRLAALVMIPDLLGAILTVHIHSGFFFDAKGGGWEFPALWIVALLVQAGLGAGAYALRPDAVLPNARLQPGE